MSVDLLRSLLLCVVIYAKKKRKKKLGLYSASSDRLLALPPRCWSRLSVIISNGQQVFAFVFLTHTHTHNKFPFSFFGGVGGRLARPRQGGNVLIRCTFDFGWYGRLGERVAGLKPQSLLGPVRRRRRRSRCRRRCRRRVQTLEEKVNFFIESC